MDFAHERYVRLYTRDSQGWLLLGWRAQTLWLQLYRKADSLGGLDLDGVQPWELGILRCGLPEEVARPGMERCLETGWILEEGARIVIPRYVEAQSAVTTGAARMREHRARELAKRAELQRNVTQLCNAPSPHAVTPRHGLLRDVTGGNETSLANSAMGATDPTLETGEIQRLEHERAAATAAWLSRANGLEPFALSRKWKPALLQIASKSEAAKALAAGVLASEAARGPDVARMLTPEHVLNWWHMYGVGKAPGQPVPLRAAAPEPSEIDKLHSVYADLDKRLRDCQFFEGDRKKILTAKMDAVTAKIKTLKEQSNGRA